MRLLPNNLCTILIVACMQPLVVDDPYAFLPKPADNNQVCSVCV